MVLETIKTQMYLSIFRIYKIHRISGADEKTVLNLVLKGGKSLFRPFIILSLLKCVEIKMSLHCVIAI